MGIFDTTRKKCPLCLEKGQETYLERRKVQNREIKVCPKCIYAEPGTDYTKPEEDLWKKKNPTKEERQYLASLLM